MSNLRTAGTLMASIFVAFTTTGCGEMSEDFVGANYASSEDQVYIDTRGLQGVDDLAVSNLYVEEEADHIEVNDDHPVLNEIDLHGRFDQYEFDFAAIELLETDELADEEDQFESTPGLGDGYGSRNEWKDIMSDVCVKLGGDLADNAFGPERGGRGHNAVSFYCSFSDEYEVKYKSFVVGGEGSCKSQETFADWAEEICDSTDNVVLHKGYGDCGGDKDNPYQTAMLFVCKSL